MAVTLIFQFSSVMILALLFVGSTNSQHEHSMIHDTANDLVNSAKNAVPELRKSLEGLAPNLANMPNLNLTENGELSIPNTPLKVNISQLPSIEEGDKLIEEKCLKNGGNGSYAEAMVAKEELQVCMKDMFDYKQLSAEIEEAKPTGDLDKVFRKYCRKSPKLKSCITNFTTSIEPCLEEEEKVSKHIIMNITVALEQFICYKEGDRIALFIGEGGKECLQDKQEAIQHCVNITYSKYLPTDMNEMPELDSLPMFKLGKEECLKINDLQKCVVNELVKCKEPTPANIVDSLMNFVRQRTPCAEYKPEGTGTAANITSNLAIMLAALLCLTALSRRH